MYAASMCYTFAKQVHVRVMCACDHTCDCEHTATICICTCTCTSIYVCHIIQNQHRGFGALRFSTQRSSFPSQALLTLLLCFISFSTTNGISPILPAPSYYLKSMCEILLSCIRTIHLKDHNVHNRELYGCWYCSHTWMCNCTVISGHSLCYGV